MPWDLYETDDKGNPTDRRVCKGWDFTTPKPTTIPKPVATFTDDEVLSIRMALETVTGMTGSGLVKIWGKLQQASSMILEKEKKDQ